MTIKCTYYILPPIVETKKLHSPTKRARRDKTGMEQQHNILHYDSSGCMEERCQLWSKQHFHCGSCQAYGLVSAIL